MEFIALVAAFAALVWGGVLLVRGGLMAGLLCVLLAGCCFSQPFFKIPLGPLPLTLDRGLLAIVAVQYLLYRRRGWTDPKPLARADWVLVGLLGVLTLSTITHNYQLTGALPLSKLLFYLVMPAATYWLARQMQLTERSAAALLASLSLFGVYLSMTAVMETHGLGSLVFPRYISSATYKEFLGRARGPLLNPAGMGVLLGASLSAALIWWQRLGTVGRTLLAATLPLFAWGVYCTFTRSAWMGAGLGGLIVVAATLPRQWRSAVVGCTLLVASVGVAANWDRLMSFKRDKALSAAEAAESAKLRPILAVVAWHMFLDRPLLGCGYGQYVPESRPYLADRSTELPLQKARPYIQHNALLSLLTETGLLGCCLYVALLVLWCRDAWRLWRDGDAPLWARQCGLLLLAVMGAWFPNAMFQDTTVIPMVHMVLFFVAGIAAGAKRSSPATTAELERRAGRMLESSRPVNTGVNWQPPVHPAGTPLGAQPVTH